MHRLLEGLDRSRYLMVRKGWLWIYCQQKWVNIYQTIKLCQHVVSRTIWEQLDEKEVYTIAYLKWIKELGNHFMNEKSLAIHLWMK
jgi:hypothetical protein